MGTLIKSISPSENNLTSNLLCDRNLNFGFLLIPQVKVDLNFVRLLIPVIIRFLQQCQVNVHEALSKSHFPPQSKRRLNPSKLSRQAIKHRLSLL